MDWQNKSASQLGRAIGEGKLDARELTEGFLAAIEAHPERDRIYARTMPDRARAEAQAAHGRVASGSRVGPLDGVPISWKDLYDTAGVATEGGSRLLAGRVPEADCTVLKRGTAAGTICLGKTHTTELAFSGLGVNPMTATAPNAIEPHRAPGGSSSGAAVSTKLGLAAAGIGSDTGGSVRIPAAWNDLVGLKTTAGVVPTEGVIALSRIYDTVGPLTHSVEDAAHLFAMLADQPVPDWDGAALTDEVLHVAETVVFDGADPEVVEAFQATIELLGKAGARISQGPVPEFQALYDTMRDVSPVITSDAWSEWGETIEANPGVMWPPIESRFRQGMNADPAKDAEGLAQMAAHSASLQDRMAQHGLIALPTSPILPPDAKRLEEDQEFFSERNLLALRNTRIGNLLTLSSITVPTPHPMCGLMLFAPPHAEERLLRIGRALEKVLG